MGTLKEVLDYIKLKSHKEDSNIAILENDDVIFVGYANEKEIEGLYDKIIIKFVWKCSSSGTTVALITISDKSCSTVERK